MDELEKQIGYNFKTRELLHRALSHSSYANENRNVHESNERLEFLGDSVLSVIVAEYLFKKFKNLPEGELTKLRAALVCEKSLAGFSREMDLGKYLLLGKGEQQNGGRERPSILADAFEALLAAMYLDGGMEVARRHVMRFVEKEVENHTVGDAFHDYKTQLQEIIQRNREEELIYSLTGESGPDHDKRFTVEVRLNSNVIGKGTAHSKKQAEQDAAKQALELMGENV